ncbi:DUF742 domain-containing protein [Streptomyces botrytidirepellens]|nr:DUF742 domain-containing protein [Streptomyces botrytidirepellens]
MTTCLITRPTAHQATPLSHEGEELLLHCSGAPRSVAELAALLHQPVQVMKVLIGDLLDCEALELTNPDGPAADGNVPILEALLDGLRKL